MHHSICKAKAALPRLDEWNSRKPRKELDTHKKGRAEPACKPGSVEDNHSSRVSVTTDLKRPTRTQRGPRLMGSYLVLLRVGFTIAVECCHPRGALLPHHFNLTGPCGLRRCTFCCTFRRLAPPRRYLALCPVEPGLSSPPCRATIVQRTQRRQRIPCNFKGTRGNCRYSPTTTPLPAPSVSHSDAPEPTDTISCAAD